MMLNLDAIAAIACFVIVIAGVAIHVTSSTRSALGWKLPQAVRSGVFVTIFFMTFRAVDFMRLASDATIADKVGHIDLWGVLASVSLAYTLGALATHMVASGLASRRPEQRAHRPF